MPVQILTHVKEKLQFAQKEKQALQAELDSVEAALATHRDDLTRVKVNRDKAKVATRKIRDAGSHVTNDALLVDMEVSISNQSAEIDTEIVRVMGLGAVMLSLICVSMTAAEPTSK